MRWRVHWYACTARAFEGHLELVKMINRGMAFLNGQPTTLVQKLAEVYRHDRSLVTVSSYRVTNGVKGLRILAARHDTVFWPHLAGFQTESRNNNQFEQEGNSGR